MKRIATIGAVSAALVGAAVISTAVWTAPSSSAAPDRTAFFGPPREVVLYGHIASLLRKGGRYELRFDPAFWLGGTTANRAAVEDGAIRPGEAVPNDYYVREEGHRLLTYRMPITARVTVLTHSGGIRSTRIPVSELVQIVRGRNPKRRSLFDQANGLGYWLRVATDTVRALDQQYQP